MSIVLLCEFITFEHVNNVSQEVFKVFLKLRSQTLSILLHSSFKNAKDKLDKVVV